MQDTLVGKDDMDTNTNYASRIDNPDITHIVLIGKDDPATNT